MGDRSVSSITFDPWNDVFGTDGGGVAVAGWKAGLLGRKDSSDVKFGCLFLIGFRKVVFVAELPANSQQEGITVGFGQVVDLNFGGIGSPPGTSTGDHRDATFLRGGKKVALCSDRIDGITNRVGFVLE